MGPFPLCRWPAEPGRGETTSATPENPGYSWPADRAGGVGFIYMLAHYIAHYEALSWLAWSFGRACSQGASNRLEAWQGERNPA